MAEPKVLESRSTSVHKRISFVAHAPDAKAVSVTGDFTGWSEKGIPLSRGAHGAWHTTLTLAPGKYQYRLRVDGQWQDHAEAHQRVPNPFGCENCVLSVDE